MVKSSASKLFKGEKFVITGAVPGYTRKEFQTDVVDKVGAVLAKGVSRNVDYVITTEDQVENGSAKIIMAKGYGITLVSADWLIDSVVEGKKLPLSDYTIGDDEKPAKKKAPKKRKKVESDDEEEDDDEEEEEEAPKKKAKGNTKALFKGLRFAMTGAVPGYTRKEFEQNVLQKLGAELAAKVTKNTDYLLSTPSEVPNGPLEFGVVYRSKVIDAKSAGIPIVSIDWLVKSLNAYKKLPESNFILGAKGSSKVVDARSKGVPIVSADWLTGSLKAGKKLPEANFTIGGKGSAKKAVKKPAVNKKKSAAKKNAEKSSARSVPSKQLFKGKVFVISGKIPDYTRAEFKQKYITGLGAKLGSSVTGVTDYVITTEEAAESGDTAKLDAAREIPVPVISYEWLIDCADEGEVLDTEDFEIN